MPSKRRFASNGGGFEREGKVFGFGSTTALIQMTRARRRANPTLVARVLVLMKGDQGFFCNLGLCRCPVKGDGNVEKPKGVKETGGGDAFVKRGFGSSNEGGRSKMVLRRVYSNVSTECVEIRNELGAHNNKLSITLYLVMFVVKDE
ncbi:hypothetical protein VIGAN_09093100 [Vigna angularis var. angularis]|uniref:Uncharacterized protein n=1 Tax=Vigna angularis var. angularis TaxID=157739 RepID=A0A0S3SXH1_PHAAN|nr:hypothetical protein VIGAN_09093100 [Vigna angularis var. angularis]